VSALQREIGFIIERDDVIDAKSIAGFIILQSFLKGGRKPVTHLALSREPGIKPGLKRSDRSRLALHCADDSG